MQLFLPGKLFSQLIDQAMLIADYIEHHTGGPREGEQARMAIIGSASRHPRPSGHVP